MKYIFILLLFVSLKGVGQHFSIDSLKNETKNDTTTFVYMTALWCSPCLDKMPYYDAYFQKTKLPIKIVYLFDLERFSYQKLRKIFPHIRFSNKIVFMPKEFYSNSAIQINSHNKMFSNFITKHRNYNPPILNLDKFTLASFITIDDKGNSIVFDAPSLKGLTVEQVDALMLKQLGKNNTEANIEL